MNKSRLLGALAGATLSLSAAQAEPNEVTAPPVIRLPILVPIVLDRDFRIPDLVCGAGWCPVGQGPVVINPQPIIRQ